MSVTANIDDTSSPATPTSPLRSLRSAGWEHGVDDAEQRQRSEGASNPGNEEWGRSAMEGGNENKDNGQNTSPTNKCSDIDRARSAKTPEARMGGGKQAAMVEDMACSQGRRSVGHHIRLKNTRRGAHGIVAQSWGSRPEESFDHIYKRGRHTEVCAMEGRNPNAGCTRHVSGIVIDSLLSYVSEPNIPHRGNQRDYSTSLLDEETLYKRPIAAEDTLYDQAGVCRPWRRGKGFLEAYISMGEVVSGKQPSTPLWQSQQQQEPQTFSSSSIMGGSTHAPRAAHGEMLSQLSPPRRRPSPRSPELPGVHLHDPLMNSSRGRLQGWAVTLARAQGMLQGTQMEDAIVDVGGMYTLMTPSAEQARNQFPERTRRRVDSLNK